MTRILIIIFLIINTSFMSKNDLWVICRKDSPNLVVMCVDAKDRPQFTTDDNTCMKFQTESAAQQFASTLNVEVGFVGTRPIRR